MKIKKEEPESVWVVMLLWASLCGLGLYIVQRSGIMKNSLFHRFINFFNVMQEKTIENVENLDKSQLDRSQEDILDDTFGVTEILRPLLITIGLPQTIVVGEVVSLSEVKKVYRTQLLKLHPDKNGNADAFIKLKQAMDLFLEQIHHEMEVVRATMPVSSDKESQLSALEKGIEELMKSIGSFDVRLQNYCKRHNEVMTTHQKIKKEQQEIKKEQQEIKKEQQKIKEGFDVIERLAEECKEDQDKIRKGLEENQRLIDLIKEKEAREKNINQPDRAKTLMSFVGLNLGVFFKNCTHTEKDSQDNEVNTDNQVNRPCWKII